MTRYGASLILLAASGAAWGSRGPLMVAYAASMLLIWRSLGIHLALGGVAPAARRVATRLGPLILIHGHPWPRGSTTGHEFGVAGKRFCAGCHGLACGTLVSLSLPTVHFLGVLGPRELTGLAGLAPLCFAPTLVRALRRRRHVSPFQRGAAYGLLAVGSWAVMTALDARFHQVPLNLAALGSVAIAWEAGGRFLRWQERG